MAITIRTRVPEIGQLMEKLGARAEKAVHKAATALSMRALTIVQDAVRTAPPANPAGKGSGGAVNTGRFLAAWEAAPAQQGGSFGVLIQVPNSKAPYAAVIEYGRTPGSRPPPVEPIARWAQRRLSLPYEQARGIAFGIARSIGRRGLKGRKILTGEKTRRRLRNAMQKELLKALIAEWGSVT